METKFLKDKFIELDKNGVPYSPELCAEVIKDFTVSMVDEFVSIDDQHAKEAFLKEINEKMTSWFEEMEMNDWPEEARDLGIAFEEELRMFGRLAERTSKTGWNDFRNYLSDTLAAMLMIG